MDSKFYFIRNSLYILMIIYYIWFNYTFLLSKDIIFLFNIFKNIMYIYIFIYVHILYILYIYFHCIVNQILKRRFEVNFEFNLDL